MYIHVLLDADNTILDFDKAELFGFQATLAFFDVEYNQRLYQKYKEINHNLWEKFEQGLISVDDIQTRRFYEFFHFAGEKIDGVYANKIYREQLAQQTWLTPNAKEICALLSKRCILSVATNGLSETQKRRIMNSEIWPYISHLIISEDIGVAKPNPLFFEKAFEIIKCNNKEQILMVGDSLTSDMQGANNIGIDACWLNPGLQSDDRGLNIQYMISDLRELPDIVFG